MKLIQLTQDKVALVDDEDYKYLVKYNWCYNEAKPGKFGFAISNIDSRNTKMHRLIMNAPKGMQVDHKNGNRLDNQRHNLRLCSSTQNNQNRHKRSNCSSIYKGVTWDKSKNIWKAAIKTNYKQCHIGNFKNERHAAMAYDIFAQEISGEFAVTNFVRAA